MARSAYIYLAFREVPDGPLGLVTSHRTFLGAFTVRHEAEAYLAALAPALSHLKLYRVEDGGCWRRGESPAAQIEVGLPMKCRHDFWHTNGTPTEKLCSDPVTP